MPSLRLRPLALAALVTSAACAASPAPPGQAPAEGAAAPTQPIAAIHAHKCNRCHTLPQPGTRTREHLTDAFSRHHNRVHLTPEQWEQMIDYLAAPSGTTEQQTR